MQTTKDLLNLLELGHLEGNVFIGQNETVGSPNVFGGQVLAQAINAAYRTITNNRILHSMHSYFLEAGDLSQSIEYAVDVIRDGGSFSTRRVKALQNNKTIFILAASFHKVEEGHEHQIEMPPEIKQPEKLLSWTDMLEKFGDFIPKKTKTFLEIPRPVEFKPLDMPNPFDIKDMPPQTAIWFKLKDTPSLIDLTIKQQILTYISDYNILSVALNRHASIANWGNTFTASLDHSIWYFRDFNFNDWLLYALDSPSSVNARGFARGNIFSRDGKLIASVAQEGLMRPIK